MQKKRLTLLMLIGLSFSLTACSSKQIETSSIAITETPMFYIDESYKATSVGNHDIEAFYINKGIETGNILISAIEAYLDDHLDPPKELEELIPKYINHVPDGPISDYVYLTQPSETIIANEPYSLCFDYNEHGLNCVYLRYLDIWDCGYYTPEQLKTLTPQIDN